MNKEVKEFEKLLKLVNPERLDEYGLMIFKGINVLLDYINQLEERIEYYYEFDEYLKKEDLPEELRPYYKNQDCCRYIVELRKENQELKKQLKDKVNQLETNWEELKKWLEEDETKAMWTISSGRHFNYNDVLNKIAELERGKE